jgi:hypothetical protein
MARRPTALGGRPLGGHRGLPGQPANIFTTRRGIPSGISMSARLTTPTAPQLIAAMALDAKK